MLFLRFFFHPHAFTICSKQQVREMIKLNLYVLIIKLINERALSKFALKTIIIDIYRVLIYYETRYGRLLHADQSLYLLPYSHSGFYRILSR